MGWRRRHQGSVRTAGLTVLLAVATAAGLTTASPVAAAGSSARVVVYGATPSGVIAAVTAARAGASVILLEPSRHVGGMMTNGLNWTDVGDATTIGGYSRELFRRIAALEGRTGISLSAASSTVERALMDMIRSTTVRLFLGERLPDVGGVTVSDSRIVSLTTAAGHRYEGRTFVDASYEGDLLARAGVPWVIGREATSQYGESLAGVRPALPVTVPTGTTMPHLGTAPGPVGSADRRVQDSNYRVCLSTLANRVPFAKPAGYRRSDFAAIAAYLRQRAAAEGVAPRLAWVLWTSRLSGSRYDANSIGSMSLALTGRNYGWSEGTAAQRNAISAEHKSWTQGLFYFLRYDVSVARPVRVAMSKFGLCKDQFTDNGNWPRQLYVREGRRMVGAYVMRQSDITTNRTKTDVIGLASYRVDAHFVSRWIDAKGKMWAEGWISLPRQTYAIPYRSLTPTADSIRNLLVPVALSASHVTYASLRMEPQWMVTGEAAGEAAAMSSIWTTPTAVQDLVPWLLQARLRRHGVRLTTDVGRALV